MFVNFLSNFSYRMERKSFLLLKAFANILFFFSNAVFNAFDKVKEILFILLMMKILVVSSGKSFFLSKLIIF